MEAVREPVRQDRHRGRGERNRGFRGIAFGVAVRGSRTAGLEVEVLDPGENAPTGRAPVMATEGCRVPATGGLSTGPSLAFLHITRHEVQHCPDLFPGMVLHHGAAGPDPLRHQTDLERVDIQGADRLSQITRGLKAEGMFPCTVRGLTSLDRAVMNRATRPGVKSAVVATPNGSRALRIATICLRVEVGSHRRSVQLLDLEDRTPRGLMGVIMRVAPGLIVRRLFRCMSTARSTAWLSGKSQTLHIDDEDRGLAEQVVEAARRVRSRWRSSGSSPSMIPGFHCSFP